MWGGFGWPWAVTVVLLTLCAQSGVLAREGSILPQAGRSDLAVTALASCGGSNWPTYLGSPTREGDGLRETSISPATASGLKELWSYPTGAEITGSSAIVNGVVYIGSWNGYEFALNASSGALLWKTFLGIDPYGNRTSGIASSPTVLGGTLYVGGGNSSWYAL